MSILRDLTTDEYGQSYDLVSIEACIGFAVGLTMYVISCFVHIHFSLIEYSGGFATLVTTTAAAARIKPRAVPNTPTIDTDSST